MTDQTSAEPVLDQAEPVPDQGEGQVADPEPAARPSALDMPPDLPEQFREAWEIVQSIASEGRSDAARYRHRLRETEAEAEGLRREAMSEQERAVAEAYDRGRSEERAEWEPRVTEARLRALAASVMRDPDDAVAMIRLEPGDGDEEMKAAIARLIEGKPYLAIDAAPAAPATDIAQGQRSGGVASSDPESWLRGTLGR